MRIPLLIVFLLAGAVVARAEEQQPGQGGPSEQSKSDKSDKSGKRKANRLAGEKSLYLLQHAYNPVQWYPWGEEAFKAAREANKPIFLSIGYSTCHWCHVMERESFENDEIAAKLNAEYIAIKVDREERPDVDEVYMAAVMAVQGRGGWPLSAFLQADGKPFFLGTYYPPDQFAQLLDSVTTAWRDQRSNITEAATKIADHLARDVGPTVGVVTWQRRLLERGFSQVSNNYDADFGGFGQPPRFRPKFPRTSIVDFLVAYHALTADDVALHMATVTLEKMSDGGIYDHVGKGFHRYSTDRRWLVPHFEKMLYDNSLIAVTYLDAYRFTRKQRFLVTAEETLGYLAGRMYDPAGAFYAAEDADSEGEEGKFYVFSRREIIDILGEEDGALYADRYGISEAGNFEHGRSVIHAKRPIDDLAKKTGKTPQVINAALENARLRVLEAREKRIPPLKDDKILTDWNAMAISATAIAYQATGEVRYLELARKAWEFIARKLVDDKGNLLHRYRDNEARYLAYFEDYAYMTTGLLDLYEASLDRKYLTEASRLANVMIDQFWDADRGGFFHTGPQHEKLIVRTKEFYDGAVPSGNSVATLALHRLADYTGDKEFVEKAGVMAKLAATNLRIGPERHPKMLHAATVVLSPRLNIVIVSKASGTSADGIAAKMLRAVHSRYLPSKSVVRLLDGADRDAAIKEIPWLADAVKAASSDAVPSYALARWGQEDFRRFESVDELGTFLDSPPKK